METINFYSLLVSNKESNPSERKGRGKQINVHVIIKWKIENEKNSF